MHFIYHTAFFVAFVLIPRIYALKFFNIHTIKTPVKHILDTQEDASLNRFFLRGSPPPAFEEIIKEEAKQEKPILEIEEKAKEEEEEETELDIITHEDYMFFHWCVV